VLAAAVEDHDLIDQLRQLVASGQYAQARKLLQEMDDPDGREVIDALVEALSADG
jgi:hypothetical protein